MEILTPYLLQLAAGVFTAATLCAVFKKLSIGVAGNILTGLTGGFIASMLMQSIREYLPAHILSAIAVAVIVTIALTVFIGLARRSLRQLH